jgi:hypothetical protein
MHVLPYIQATHIAPNYYSPHQFQSSKTYVMQPAERILVTLDHHGQLRHLGGGTSVCANKTGPCCYAIQEKLTIQETLAILVTNTSHECGIHIPMNTRLNELLGMKAIQSQFVTLPKAKKRKISQNDPSSSSSSSCTSTCDHSDIDDE